MVVLEQCLDICFRVHTCANKQVCGQCERVECRGMNLPGESNKRGRPLESNGTGPETKVQICSLHPWEENKTCGKENNRKRSELGPASLLQPLSLCLSSALTMSDLIHTAHSHRSRCNRKLLWRNSSTIFLFFYVDHMEPN